jgi:esterase/lipase
LDKILEEKGYFVNPVNPNWYRPLSEQVFNLEKEAVIFGFSFGAVLAYLIGKKHDCKKIIFGSISPLQTFSLKSLIDDYEIHMDKKLAREIAEDIKSIKISLKSLTTPHVSLAGEFEMQVIKDNADVLVPKTKHYLSKAYIESVVSLLQ